MTPERFLGRVLIAGFVIVLALVMVALLDRVL